MGKNKKKTTTKNPTDFTRWLPLVIIVMALVQYANTLGHEYAWDDAFVIRDNPQTQKGIKGLKEIWTQPVFIPQRDIYRPIPQTTFALEKAMFPDGNPGVGHLLNILLYALCCYLLFYFFRILLPKGHLIFAFLAGLLFLTHPTHTEVVANIKSRDEILALIFGISSLIQFIRFKENKSWKHIAYTLLFFIMAMLSKANAITLLAVYPLIYLFSPSDGNNINGTFHQASYWNRDTFLNFYGNRKLYEKIIMMILLSSPLLIGTLWYSNSLIALWILLPLFYLILFWEKTSHWEIFTVLILWVILGFNYNAHHSFLPIFICATTYNLYKFDAKKALLLSLPFLIIFLIFVNNGLFLLPSILLYALLPLLKKKWINIILAAGIPLNIFLDYSIAIVGIAFLAVHLYNERTWIIKLILALLYLYISFVFIKQHYIENPIHAFENVIVYENDNSDNTINSKQLELSKINNSLVGTTPQIKYPTTIGLQLEYFKKSIYPIPLVHNYGINMIPDITWSHYKVWLSILLIGILMFFSLYRLPQKDFISWGILFFIITMSVYSNVVLLAPDTFADRFLFLPTVGSSIAIVYILANILNFRPDTGKNKQIFYGLLGLIILSFFYLTFDRNKDWENNYTLATHTLEYCDQSALIHANGGVESIVKYDKESQDIQYLNDAVGHFNNAINVHPQYVNAYLDLGETYLKLGKVDDAEKIYTDAISINSKNIYPYHKLGLIAYSKSEFGKGVEFYEKARSIILNAPDRFMGSSLYEENYLFLARCYFNTGNLESAQSTLLEASNASGGNNPNYVLLMANMAAQSGNMDLAIQVLETFNSKYPNQQQILEKINQLKQNQ